MTDTSKTNRLICGDEPPDYPDVNPVRCLLLPDHEGDHRAGRTQWWWGLCVLP